jgi:hypothetical protein
MTRILLRTNNRKSIFVDVQRVPNIGEEINVMNISELYDDRGGQSPVWKVKNVTTDLEALQAFDESYEIHNTGIIVDIVNEDE